MAQGWKTAFTINGDSTTKTNLTHMNKTIRSMKTPSLEQLQREFDAAYEKQNAEDVSILAAFENKQLKSKNLIKKAIKLQKIKEKAEQKKAETATAES